MHYKILLLSENRVLHYCSILSDYLESVIVCSARNIFFKAKLPETQTLDIKKERKKMQQLKKNLVLRHIDIQCLKE